MNKYKIARVFEGVGFKNDFEIIEEFESDDNDSANKYAEDNYSDLDWYVLDYGGDNINS